MTARRLLSVLATVFTMVAYSEGCQGPWELQTKGLSYGNVVGFKNITTIGKQESLSWSWTGENRELWEFNMLRSLEEEKMEGKITYRKVERGQKIVVLFSWAIKGNHGSSSSNGKRIYSKPWTLSICNILNVDFISDKTGSWLFKIGDFFFQKKPDETNAEKQQYNVRRKRADYFEITEYGEGTTNVTQQPRGTLDSIYDYFFGEDDPTTGRSAGIFTRVKNWMKDFTCRLGGTCEEYYPPPTVYSPMGTIPPSDPDAETITEEQNSKDNDVL